MHKLIGILILFFFSSYLQASEISPDVIYGDDNRLDLYQVEDPILSVLASSSVALVKKRNLRTREEGVHLVTRNFGESYQLCSSERFRDQESGAFCSGFLVNETTIVTAGHCIRTDNDCEDTRFLFDFAIKTPGAESPRNFSDDQVFKCKKLVHSEARGNGADFAIVELDRPVVGRSPLSFRETTNPTVGDPLVVIGHPAGLPTKVAAGANVRSLGNKFFVANLDTYGGNSGSAVLNASNGKVEGILVRGELDFIYKNGCRVSNVCTDMGCRGEDVTNIHEVKSHISGL